MVRYPARLPTRPLYLQYILIAAYINSKVVGGPCGSGFRRPRKQAGKLERHSGQAHDVTGTERALQKPFSGATYCSTPRPGPDASTGGSVRARLAWGERLRRRQVLSPRPNVDGQHISKVIHPNFLLGLGSNRYLGAQFLHIATCVPFRANDVAIRVVSVVLPSPGHKNLITRRQVSRPAA